MKRLAFSSLIVPKRWLLPFLAITLFVIQLGTSLSDLPFVKLMQDIICKRDYSIMTDELLPEADCHIESVQQELNTISMGVLISTTVGSALVSFPLGILADRAGRLPVLALSLLSMCLAQLYAMFICWQWRSVPLQAIWGLGGVLMVGGGRSVAEAMVFTIISDTVSAGKRATWFQIVTASVLFGQLLAPIIAGKLVLLSVWTTLFVSLGLMFGGGAILIVFTPESLPARTYNDSFNATASDARQSILQTLKSLFSGPAAWLLPGAVLTIPLASIQSELLFRLMPFQFGWSLSRSALVISQRSLVTLVTLVCLLPGVALLWRKFMSTRLHHADSAMACGSATLVMIGSMFLMIITEEAVLMTGLVMSALGSGLPTLCRAMLVSCARRERTGSVFGVLAVGELIGFLAFELSMGSLFGLGLRSWMGWPFCLGMCFALMIGCATWLAPTSWTEDLEEQEL